MTIDTVRDFVFRIVHRRNQDGGQLIAEDPISKECIDEMQREIDSKLRKGMKFTPAGPSGW